MYDLVIIGGGPAGFSASLTARKRNLKTCIIYPKENNSWLTKIKKIDNYLGLINMSGSDMLTLFENQAKDMGVEFHNGVVQKIIHNNKTFIISIGEDYIETKKIIIATGIKKPYQLKNENKFLGKGISYCATCDGMFYKNKTIAILDELHNKDEIDFLVSIAKKVYLISDYPYSFKDTNIEILKGKIKSIEGDNKINYINIDDKQYNIDGFFIFRKTIALKELISDLELQNNFIKVNKEMATNIPNIYAAGDCTGEPLQIAKAVGEGNIAAISASLE